MRATLLLVCLSASIVMASAAIVTTAQPTGAVVGAVTDWTGARLPGVTVSVANGDWFRQVTTVSEGTFRLPDVPAGSYTFWFSILGFTTVVERQVTVAAGPEVALNARLQVAPMSRVVTISSHSPTPVAMSIYPPEIGVQLETGLGTITMAVDAGRAPITAGNFLKYVDDGFYTNGRFHRATRADNYTIALPNRPLLEVIQAGINPARKADSLPPIPLERTSVTGLKHVVGTVSMARGTADSATSDFFILLNNQPSLDYGGKRFDDEQGAAAFGRVVEGMDVVRKIQSQPTSGQSLTPPIAIISAKRLKP